MCLTKKARFRVKSDDEGYIGWKIFIVDGDDLVPAYQRAPVFEPGKWVFDNADYPLAYANSCGKGEESFRPYPSGFHCFVSKGRAEYTAKRLRCLPNSRPKDMLVKEVRAKEIVAKGRQGGYRVFVTKELKVIDTQNTYDV